jgi:hypothetical protein
MKEIKMQPIRRLKYTQLAHLLGITRYRAIQMVKKGTIRDLTVADYGQYMYRKGWIAALEAAKRATEDVYVR